MACEVFHRLPRLCHPIRYIIEIKPCLKTFKFSGKESVSLEMVNGASEIVLNAKDLTINSARFNGNPIEVVQKPEVERVHLPLGYPSQPGSATLDLEFTGELSDKMTGFYRSTYSDDNDEKKIMLATHFEPSCARQAFPCWDEPDFKSVFSIKLFAPKHMTAISNMPVLSQVDHDDHYVAYQFEDTPKMSSYLVAFAIGELEYVEARDSDNVLVRVYSRPGFVSQRGQGELALNTACRSLPFFGDYFGIRYPLPKLDLLAVPDFAGGAMENWGLVTFRERSLLADKDAASAASKESIALTVSHELAHMWFGNLVTMRWWTDLWLKEGFATWIEYLCVNHCFPEMDIWTHFTYGELACALRLDALTSSHPIEVEVSSPDEIDEIFDTISYCKGSSLIHMLHAFLGDQAFRAGLCTYLAQHAYNNATTEDLWTALAAASGVDVATIMRPWTRTAGFPVLSVQPVMVRDGRLTVQLRQQQYRLPSAESTAASSSQLWPIPVVFVCTSDDNKHITTHKHVLYNREEEVEIPLTWPATDLQDCLVRVNTDATGFYHVHYPNDQMPRLIAHMKSTGWSTPSRFAFINDGFCLAKAGTIRISDWLSLLPQLLKGEEAYSIWRCVLVDGLATYVRRLIHESDVPISAYHLFLRKIARPALDRLDFLGDPNSSTKLSASHDTSLLRSLLVMTVGAEAGDPEVIDEAKRRYLSHKSGGTPLPGDLRAAVYSTVVRHGSPDIVEELMQAYRVTKCPEERAHILSALGGASESQPVAVPASNVGDPTTTAAASKTLLQHVLAFCLDPNGPVRDQDRIHGLSVCASWSSPARLCTWEAMKSDWPRLSAVYHGQFLLAHLIKGVLCGFASEERIADVKDFFETRPVSCPRALSQVHETMEANRFLLKRDIPLISAALAQLVNDST